ncbi:hypothetical protein ACL03H_21315 [Saccharopolyspora sp. MS10]|uniref:hypothetical protein n=1 Tax=Saccharopolyspora sp. MS10 TaxID=3385973 RepID=UPI0039A0B90F
MARLTWIGAATAALLLGAAPQAAAAGWADEPLPPLDGYAALTSAAAGDGVVWAVGGSMESNPVQHSLAYLRDARGWREVPVPDVGRLDEVAVIGAADAWATGADIKYGIGSALHWDGTTWSEVPFTAPGNRNAARGLAAFGPADVWAVGSSFDDGAGTGRGLVQHWDGAAWRDVAVPEREGNWTLGDVGGIAADDVWAVGGDSGYGQGLALHWDGAAWSEVPVPAIELDEYQSVRLTQVQPLAADDVWATGQIQDSADPAASRALLLHWDGGEWSVAPSPQGVGPRGDLVRVGDELWSLGENALRFDGDRWQVLPGPSAGVPAGGTELADGDLLAVGGAGRYPGQERPFASVHQD